MRLAQFNCLLYEFSVCRKNFPSFSHSEQETRYDHKQYCSLFPGLSDILEECPSPEVSLYSTTWQLLCRLWPSSGVVFPMRAPCFYVSLTPPALSAFAPRACLTWTIFVLAGGLSEMVLPTSFSYVLLEQWLANLLVS